MVKKMSKNWITRITIVSFYGALLVCLLSVWFNLFSKLLVKMVDLPVPDITAELATAKITAPEKEKSASINKIAYFPDEDPKVRVPYTYIDNNVSAEKLPEFAMETYKVISLSESAFLISIPSVFKSVEMHGTEFIDNVQQYQHIKSNDSKPPKYEQPLDEFIKQFQIPSHYASFFAVTLMQDRLPPAISQNSVSTVIASRKAYSPKPQLRPQNVDNRILIAIGYFNMKQNLDRTLQTLELTGYPYSHKRLDEQEGTLVTVGPFKNKSSAKKALEITKFMGFSDAYILN